MQKYKYVKFILIGSIMTITMIVISIISSPIKYTRPDVPIINNNQSYFGPRIWYPANHYPILTLPDGQRRTIRSVLNIQRPMHFGDYIWNEERIPQGTVWIRVDLNNQTLSVFRDGHEIGSSVILYGANDKPTPTGTFAILEKAEKYTSKQYDADMPFMLRLTTDGVALHASNVRKGFATHGCIGLPLSFARRLFAQMQTGDLVAIIPATS